MQSHNNLIGPIFGQKPSWTLRNGIEPWVEKRPVIKLFLPTREFKYALKKLSSSSSLPGKQDDFRQNRNQL